MADPTPEQVLDAAKRLANNRTLGVHPRCMPDLKLMDLEPADALEVIAGATLSQIVKCEPDDKGRPFVALELSIPHPHSPTGLLYVKPVLAMPDLLYGRILSFKPSSD